LVYRNQKAMYTLLIKTAAQMLKAYGKKYLGGEMGITIVLHTWGQQMQQHLHCHCIVTGGALVRRGKGYRWQRAKHKYLFPVKLLSKEYRAAFCKGLEKLWEEKKIETRGEDVEGMLKAGREKNWEVYIQPPIEGVDNLLDYLGKYLYRIAISNHRIVAVKRGKVTFEYYDNREDGKKKTTTITAVEFIGRFMMHVLPRRFMRARHYGLHHASCRKKLQEARKLLGVPKELPVMVKLKMLDWLKTILDIEDPDVCPKCGEGRMLVLQKFGPVAAWRVKLMKFLGMFIRWRWAT